MKKSGTVIRRDQSDSPAARHLPLVDILVDAQAELQALVVASGLKVLEAMLEEDRVAVCGPRYTHQPHRRASRAGHAPSEVVLGGRKVAIRRPRVRRDGREVALPSVAAFTDTDPLNRRVVEQMLIGVATRQYDRSLEPLGADVRTRGTSKSAVSRRFVAQTQAQLDAWRATPLDDLDLVALLIDGVQVGGHCIVVALGIDQTGRKHALGLWEGSTTTSVVPISVITPGRLRHGSSAQPTTAIAPALGDRERRVPARLPTGGRWDVLGPRADLLDADDIGAGPVHKIHEPVPDTRANPVDVPAHDPHSFRLQVVGDRLHWSPAPHSPVERGDSLPEHGRRRAFPCLPLIDDGLPRRAHQRGQLCLAQAARASKRANLHIVVVWHTRPARRLSSV